MAEFPFSHRQSVTTLLGTANATILGPAPPQQSYEITEVAVTSLGGGTVTGRLLQFGTLSGYSQFGTVAGTVVEPFQVNPGAGGQFVDGNGSAPIAYVSPGCNLYGQVDSGSVLCKVTFRPVYRRG